MLLVPFFRGSAFNYNSNAMRNIEKAWKLLPVKCLEICGTASLSGVKAFEIFMICTCLRYGFISHLSSTYYLKDNRGQERGVVDMDFLGYGFFAVVSRNE